MAEDNLNPKLTTGELPPTTPPTTFPNPNQEITNTDPKNTSPTDDPNTAITPTNRNQTLGANSPKESAASGSKTVADLNRPKVVSQAEANFTQEEKDLMKPLRTYQSDAASLVKNEEADIIKINVAEQKRKEVKRQEIAKLPKEKRPAPTSTRNTARLATIVSIILVLLGSSILGAIWLFRPSESDVVFETPSTIIPYDQKVVIDLSGEDRQGVINAITDQVNQVEAPLSAIVYFELISGLSGAKTVIDFDNLLIKINSEIPEPLRRALGKRFMSGALVFNDVKPFVIFTTDYFDIAFPGMLDWESYLYRDFGALLGTARSASPAQTPTSTASLLSQSVSSPGFSDVVIANRDTRVLSDINGQTVLVYSFLDQNTIIITPDEVVFREILNKFLNAQLIR